MSKDTSLLVTLGTAGVIIGFAQLLSAGDKITMRLLLARAILSGALGVAAAAASLVFPTMSFAATVGLACVMSSLGTSAIEKMFQRVIGR